MAIERVVVEINLRVERNQLAIARDDQRIDFDHRRICFEERAIERLQERQRYIYQLAGQPQTEGELASVVRLETRLGTNHFFQNCGRLFLRHFLDFHAPRGAGHNERRSRGTIEQNAEIQLPLYVETLFDEQAANDAPLFARLDRDELHAQHALGDLLRLFGRLRELHTTRLAAPTRMD